MWTLISVRLAFSLRWGITYVALTRSASSRGTEAKKRLFVWPRLQSKVVWLPVKCCCHCRAVACDRQTDALVSVIFFSFFVVSSYHSPPKYLGRESVNLEYCLSDHFFMDFASIIILPWLQPCIVTTQMKILANGNQL